MNRNGLKMNAEKTQLAWFGTRQQLTKLTISSVRLVSATVDTTSTITDLGVLLDDQMSMAAYISSTCKSCFFHLRQLSSVRRSLTQEAVQALVQAFVISRLDYCNSLLAGVADVHLRRLQSAQNAAARMVSRAHRHDHIRPVLNSLHWLPVSKRVVFKTAVLIYKCLHQAAPRYLIDLCVPLSSVPGRQHLRSAASGGLIVPRTRTSYGQRSFAVYGPSTWNSLPTALRSPELTLPVFKRQLKTYLFQRQQ